MKKILTKQKSRICLLVNLVLYIGFVLIDGPVWCRDSESYVAMEPMREPLYCSFLAGMRAVFGDHILVRGWDLTDRLDGKAPAMEPLYLEAAVLVQSAVAACTVWYLAKTCWEIGKARSVKRAAAFAAMANVVPWGLEALNRFGAKRSSTYTQSIMTEGFGISFYILFILFLYRFLKGRFARRRMESAESGVSNAADCRGKREGKADHQEEAGYCIAALIMAALCMLLHKQLGITAIIFFFACLIGDGIYVWERKPRRQKLQNTAGTAETGAASRTAVKFFGLLLKDTAAVAVCLLAVFLVEHTYNLAIHGTWTSHTGSADKVDSTLLYTASESDADLIENPGLRGLFLAIEGEMEQQKLRYVDVPESGGWVELCSHYADAYDVIGFEVLDPAVERYVASHYPEMEENPVQRNLLEDQVCQNLEAALIHQDPSRLVHLWISNFRKGFVNTVLRVSSVLNWASLVLWAVYCGALVRLVVRLRREETAGQEERGLCILAGLVLLGTAVNAAVVGAIIFPQTRYMIYNMALFYICLFMMLADAGRSSVKHNRWIRRAHNAA